LSWQYFLFGSACVKSSLELRRCLGHHSEDQVPDCATHTVEKQH
jgi:hypothetical protein